MKRSILQWWLVAIFLFCRLSGAQAQTDAPKITTIANAQTKVALTAVATAKLATVLVDTPNSNGSAFCVHTSGIFVTNAHVVEGFSKVRIVVNPGEVRPAILHVRVSHYDSEKDLAVLIADPPLQIQAPRMAPLTALPLGDSSALFETTPIAVFGFPYGTDLALGVNELPSVTVTTGRVTSLRKLQGVLKEIQLDAATNPGNSGGPVINDQGQVVGIMHAAIEGAQGLNFAIPVETLRSLLTMPEVRFTPSPIPFAKRQEINEWTVQIATLPQFSTMEAANYDFDFMLTSTGAYRHLEATRVSAEGAKVVEYLVKGQPFKEFEDSAKFQKYKIFLRQNDKIVLTREGTINAMESSSPSPRIGRPNFGQPERPDKPVLNPSNGHWYQCIGVRPMITWSDAKAAAEAMTHAGFKGHLATITSDAEEQFIVDRIVGNATLGDDKAWIGGLQKVNGIEPDKDWQWATKELWKYTNWAAGEPNNLGEEDNLQMLFTGGWNDAKETDPCAAFLVEFEPTEGFQGNNQPIDTPRIEGNKTIIDLPALVTEAIVGGGGRYLLFYLKSAQKVAVFDAQAKKIVRYIPALGSNVLLAASQEKLVLLLTEQNILQRWNLQTGLREQSIPLPDDKAVTSMAMGSSSNGPLLIVRMNEVSFLDLSNFQKTNLIDERNSAPNNQPLRGNAVASPDGSIYALVQGSGTYQMWMMVREKDRLSPDSMSGSFWNAQPSFDGRWWFTRQGMFTDEGKAVVAEQLRDKILIPAYSPAYFMALKNGGNQFGNNRRTPVEITIYSANDRRELVSLGAFEEVTNSENPGRNPSSVLPLEKRIHYFPNSNLLVTIGDGMDEIVLRQVDLKTELSRDGNKYFFVASTPPRRLTKGSMLNYQLEVLSQAAGVKYTIESGPANLTITPTGLVQWKVPTDFIGDEVTALITVSNSAGQELYHLLKIQIK